MARWKRSMALVMLLAAITTGCAAPAPDGPARTPSAVDGRGQASSAPKRMIAAIPSELDLQPAGQGSGSRELRQLVNAGLTILDDHGERRGQLAEVFPTLENGLWKLLPAGRMQTTWNLRRGARWNDA